MSISSPQSPDLPLVVVPKRYNDDRGWFSETFRQQRLYDLGITCSFIQENQSSSRRAGTVRGFHFQRPPAAQAKLLAVFRGRILDIAVDIRRASPSFGKHVSIELSVEGGQQLYIPIGFAHGFVCLEDDVLVAYKVSDYYAPLQEGGIRWDDPDIAFPWPFKNENVITSEKDARLPNLKDFESPFAYDGHPLQALRICNLG
jgi:dTDP-4-dehydrorhamnose 3,5-epimerase